MNRILVFAPRASQVSHFKLPVSDFRSPVSALILLGLLAVPACAQDQPTLAPETVMAQTLAHSLDLQAADQELRAASARRSQARAQALPALDARLFARHYEGLANAPIGPEFTLPVIEDRYSASVGLTQPLYTGGRITSRQRSAAQHESAVRASRQGVAADLALQALTAYWNWSKAFHSVVALRAALARVEAHTADMHSLFQAGMATDNEALATEVLLDQTRLRLEDAQRRVELARARIAFLTGQMPDAAALPLPPVTPAEEPVAAEAAAREVAATNRTELAAARMEALAAEALVHTSRADFWPQVFLTARYEEARPNLQDFPPVDEWSEEAFVGGVLSWDFWDWGLTRGRTAEAAAHAAQADLRRGQVEEQITLQVREARINLLDARERLKVAERVAQSAQRNLTAATDQWQNGLARHSDVLDAQAQLTDAQYLRVAAQADVLLARAALDHAQGLLGPKG
jgi:outer membrane protein